MKRIRLFVSFAFAAGLIAVTAAPAFACSCAMAPSDKAALKDSYAVFAGTVIDTVDPLEGHDLMSSADPIEYEFEVDLVAKGDVDDRQSVFSTRDSASCGFAFAEGKRYLVFAHPGKELAAPPDADPKGEFIQTYICTNTREIGDGEELPFPATAVSRGAPAPDPPADRGGIDMAKLTMWAVLATVALGAVWLARRPKTSS